AGGLKDMERDLNGFPIPSDYQIFSRRDALDMAAMAQQAIDAGLFADRADNEIDPATHKPQSKWTRKDGTTGQREAWRRELTGYQTGQKEKAKAKAKREGEPPTISPTP
ncbi:hypothetical protein ABNQ39_00005, partial (plasmid) [Azospirillum sp. A26]|uniref:hypothetical protein n=1 Tax=Azospirillum sp. A26 TaxID=3160607 RepID=UPI00366C8A26